MTRNTRRVSFLVCSITEGTARQGGAFFVCTKIFQRVKEPNKKRKEKRKMNDPNYVSNLCARILGDGLDGVREYVHASTDEGGEE